MPSTARISLPERYRLRGHIANGGMAAVWAADDQVLGRPVAIKVLALHLAEEPVNAARFQREARAAAQLSTHPNVVTVYDVGEHEGRAFIVMERAEGGSVADRLREGRPTREQALGWLRETAAALDYAHEQGIVHRDVKPANLLLDGSGHVRVADFGIARIATEDTMTQTGQLLGTAAYFSPEQIEGEGAIPASDRYSLAVVAFELLTGERPFGGDTIAAQARQHIEVPPPRASDRDPDLPARLDMAVQRGMAKDPEARWPSAGAFVEGLDQALRRDAGGRRPRTQRTVPLPTRRGTVPPTPPAPPAPGPAAPRAGRPRRAVLVAAVIALVVAGAAVADALGRDGSGGGDQAGAGASTPTQAKGKAKPKAKATKTTGTTPAAPATSSTPTTSTPSGSETTPDQSSSSSGSTSAAALQSKGHALLTSGDPDGAIPVLQQAVKATGKSTDDCLAPTGDCLTYAYALFDLGVAYDASGNPNAAIPVLEDRLRIDNQRGAVQAELDKARAAAGGAKTPPGQTKPKAKSTTKHHGPGPG